MLKKFNDLLALVYIGVLLIWLGVVCFFLLPLVIGIPESVDPMMALVAGLGIGGITQFFIVIGTLIAQYYWRKKPPTGEGE